GARFAIGPARAPPDSVATIATISHRVIRPPRSSCCDCVTSRPSPEGMGSARAGADAAAARVRAAISEKRFSFEVMVRLPGFVFVTIAWSYYDRTMNCTGQGFAPHAGPSGTARMISPRESTPWAVSLHTTECRDP